MSVKASQVLQEMHDESQLLQRYPKHQPPPFKMLKNALRLPLTQLDDGKSRASF